MSVAPTLVWFRQDLRLADNAALAAACERGGPIIPVYILDEPGEGGWSPGGASRWWLHHSLTALEQSLQAHGSRLILGRGDAWTTLLAWVKATGASAVYWNRRYEPAAVARDTRIKAALGEHGCEARSFNSALLFEPHTVANRQGNPFQVFSPFWRHVQEQPVPAEVGLPRGGWASPSRWPVSEELASWGWLPKVPWDAAFAGEWTPGEAGARQRLKAFFAHSVENYERARDHPADVGVSRLSPHLHFGEIGPRQIWAAAKRRSAGSGVFPENKGTAKFLGEIGWREFAYHLLFHFPRTPEQPLRAEFAAFPWARDPGGRKLRAWQRGQTGYPIVDAGMRQLWTTGWMHNRVRMIVASFLVKHLRLPWNAGAAWFWDTLVDADLANNTLGWQWSAGCGADAAPYFRIFAPVLQGEKFDADGRYVRRWVPEVACLPDAYLHRPWEAPADVSAQAGFKIGRDYPAPVVDHATARAEALAALQQLRRNRPTARP